MSLGRRRNVYTLGDYQTKLQETDASLPQRLKPDPFERDPFKIHSYNFHYADRPIYPLGPIVSPTPNPAVTKPFNTVFYNYDFAAHRANKENNSANSFHEYRRRKFLHDYQATTANMYGGSSIPNTSEYCDDDGQQSTWLLQQHTPAPQTMHELQFQSPYIQYGQLQSQQQQLPHQQQQQQRCDRQEFTAFGASRGTPGNACQQTKQANDSPSTDYRATTSTPYGRTHMPNYPSAASTLTSIYQRDTSNRNRLSRLYGFPTGNACREEITNTNNENRGANCKPITIASGSGSGGVGYVTPEITKTTKSNSRTSLGSIRARSPAGRGLSKENGYGSGSCNHTSVLADKTNCADTATTTKDREGYGQQQRDVRLASGRSNGNSAYTTGVARCLSPSRSRRPMQVIHAPTQTLVSSRPPEVKRSTTSSGCRIDINIKSGDDSRMLCNSEKNVTIKIETDPHSNRSIADIETNGLKNANLYYAKTGPMCPFTSPGRQNNLNATRSNETLIIDKHISKFSIMNDKGGSYDRRRSHSVTPPANAFARRQSDHSIFDAVRKVSGVWGKEKQLPITDLKAEWEKRGRGKNVEERMPSRLSWHLDTGIRDGYGSGKESGSPCIDFDSTSSIQRVRSNYNDCLKNLHNLKKFNNEQLAAMASKSPRKSRAEYKLLNTINGLKRTSSRNSLCNNLENRRQPLKPMPLNSQLQLHSHCVAAPAATTSSSVILKRSRQSISQPPPLKVNINVYTDKLKLLRI